MRLSSCGEHGRRVGVWWLCGYISRSKTVRGARERLLAFLRPAVELCPVLHPLKHPQLNPHKLLPGQRPEGQQASAAARI